MPSVNISAPAKINLCLKITGRRQDGFHLLQMLNVPLALSDEISISSPVPPHYRRARAGPATTPLAGTRRSPVIMCDSTEVPTDETNLCYKAAVAMREASDVADNISISIAKRIPVGGGLGGGSSDAASVLIGLNQLWGLGWTKKRLAEIGAGIGADVPFFCFGRSAVVGGIGDQVEICEQFPQLLVLLINPYIHVSTKWAYAQYDLNAPLSKPPASLGLKKMSGGRVEGLTHTISHDSQRPRFFEGFREVSSLLANDLEVVVAAHYPVIRDIVDELKLCGASAAQMSGSGSTVFGLFETRESRDAAAALISRKNWLVIPTESLSIENGKSKMEEKFR